MPDSPPKLGCFFVRRGNGEAGASTSLKRRSYSAHEIREVRRSGDDSLEVSSDGLTWSSASKLARLAPELEFDVFLSCDSRDYKTAKQIHDILQDKLKLKVFLCTEELRQTSNFKTVLKNAILKSHALVLLASKFSLSDEKLEKKKPYWVYDEVALAHEADRSVIPFRIDNDNSAKRDSTLAFELRDHQWIEGPKWQDNIEKLVEFIVDQKVSVAWFRKLLKSVLRRGQKLGLSTLQFTAIATIAAVLIVGVFLALLPQIIDRFFPKPPAVPTPTAAMVSYSGKGTYHAHWFDPATKTRIPKSYPGMLGTESDELRNLLSLIVDTQPTSAARKVKDQLKNDLRLETTNNVSGVISADAFESQAPNRQHILQRIGNLLAPCLSTDFNAPDPSDYLILRVDRKQAMLAWNESAGPAASETFLEFHLAFDKHDGIASIEELNKAFEKFIKSRAAWKDGELLERRMILLCGEIPRLLTQMDCVANSERELRNQISGKSGVLSLGKPTSLAMLDQWCGVSLRDEVKGTELRGTVRAHVEKLTKEIDLIKGYEPDVKRLEQLAEELKNLDLKDRADTPLVDSFVILSKLLDTLLFEDRGKIDRHREVIVVPFIE